MVFDWHIPDDRKGELLWIGNPFLYENGIFQEKAYVQTEDGCYYSYHAWSQLPYLKIGGLCSNGKSPMPVFAETKGNDNFTETSRVIEPNLRCDRFIKERSASTDSQTCPRKTDQ